jgi:hypothetical protein
MEGLRDHELERLGHYVRCESTLCRAIPLIDSSLWILPLQSITLR